MAKDFYQILGITKNATKEQIKQAYRKLAMQYHPDRNPGKEKWANEKFKEINEAFSVLGDPEKRKRYDQFGTAENVGDVFGSSATRTTFEDLMKDFGGAGLKFDFLDSIFGEALKGKNFSFRTFNMSGSPGAGMRFETYPGGINLADLFGQMKQPVRQDVRYEITISKDQAKHGLEKDLTRNKKKLRVKIPAKIKNRTQIRLKNALQTTDSKPGDIIIVVNVK